MVLGPPLPRGVRGRARTAIFLHTSGLRLKWSEVFRTARQTQIVGWSDVGVHTYRLHVLSGAALVRISLWFRCALRYLWLLMDEIVKPFFLFQVFSIAVWLEQKCSGGIKKLRQVGLELVKLRGILAELGSIWHVPHRLHGCVLICHGVRRCWVNAKRPFLDGACQLLRGDF